MAATTKDRSPDRRTEANKTRPEAGKRSGNGAGEDSKSRAGSPGKPVPGATAKRGRLRGKGTVVSSKLAYKGPVFSVYTDQVIEPGNIHARRDVVRHSGSVVVLAVDPRRNPADPDILTIRQYRHTAGQFLVELPAGRIDENEAPLAAAKRELIEETGYRARRWSRHTRYFASPGFLCEVMNVYLAEDLTEGEAEPEEDEIIEVEMTPLSTVLKMIDDGRILDGKTIVSVLLYKTRLG